MSERKAGSSAIVKTVIAGSSVVLLGAAAVWLGLRGESKPKVETPVTPDKELPGSDETRGGGLFPTGRPELTGNHPPRKTIDFGAQTGSAIVHDAARQKLYALDQDGNQVVVLDPVTLDVLATIAVGKRPAQMVVDHSGRAFVTLRDEGAVAIVEDGQVKKVSVGADPFGVALSPDHLTAYVVAGGSNRMVALDTESLRERFRVTLPEMARGIAAGPTHVAISHAAGAFVSVVDVEAARATSREERGNGASVQRVALFTGDNARRPSSAFSIVIDSERGRAIVPHLSMDTGETRPQVERVFSTYGGGDPECSQPMQVVLTGVDLSRHGLDAAVKGKRAPSSHAFVNQFQTRGHSLPRSITLDGKNKLMLLGDDGTHRVSVFALDHNGFASLTGVLDAPNGARGMAVTPDGKTAYVVASFARTVEKYDLDRSHGMAPRKARATRRLGDETLGEKLALGRKLFHDGADKRISSSGMACATCHPDGLRDNNVWTTDVGNRRTAILAGRLAGTAPYHWRGERPTLQVSIKATIERLGGKGLPRKDAEALGAYLLAMPVPAIDGGDEQQDLVDEGFQIFMSAETQCAGCHQPGMGFRDGKLHDVGTANAKDKALGGGKFMLDTPSLIGIKHGGPYYHDGSAKTLEELVDGANKNGRHMGDTAHLTEHQKKALVAYLKTL